MTNIINVITFLMFLIIFVIINVMFFVGAFFIILWLVSFFLSGNIAVVAAFMILFIITVSGAISR